MIQPKFSVYQDNRSGRVFAEVVGYGDANASSYNIDPGENQNAPVSRYLEVQQGDENNLLKVSLNTQSEFLDYQVGECSGLRLKSTAAIYLPRDKGVQALGIVQDRLQMGFNLPQLPGDRPVTIILRTNIESDLDIIEIKLNGPSFSQPHVVNETPDGILEEKFTLTQPGEYSLTAGYQLAVQLPNSGLGGRDIKAEMFAEIISLPF
ncbi:hypothetical protein H6G41_14645 [Tolypothrix sp. FACHB-123]|uniref:hypothetical protein n=1 Tax=Tolypothrix sp. FACHB-123 TaxID=2692868 RepID=UPI001683EDD6|nr:hypothetical protein [Tolypothrix sp. FACHB-123]MBD2355840.1 hypothetical protein [Tolypothrix sp. FACHB-123]